MEKKYRVKKILNNNAVHVTANFLEYIVIGLGIGYHLKPMQVVPNEKIEKVFALEKEDIGRVMRLAQEVPQDLFMDLYNLIDTMAKKFNTDLDNHAYIAMIDHIQFSIERLKKDQKVQNLMNPDLKIIYHSEYIMAQNLLESINAKLDVNLPDDEIGFLTIHIVNGLNTSIDNQTNKITDAIYDSLNIIRDHYLLALKLESPTTQRITIHLKMLIQRVISKTQILEDNLILENVLNDFDVAGSCALKIQDHLEKRFKTTISKQELIYLTIHLNRLETQAST